MLLRGICHRGLLAAAGSSVRALATATVDTKSYTVGVVGTGRLFTWGAGKEGQLGRVTSEYKPADLPVEVTLPAAAPVTWKQVACARC